MNCLLTISFLLHFTYFRPLLHTIPIPPIRRFITIEIYLYRGCPSYRHRWRCPCLKFTNSPCTSTSVLTFIVIASASPKMRNLLACPCLYHPSSHIAFTGPTSEDRHPGEQYRQRTQRPSSLSSSATEKTLSNDTPASCRRRLWYRTVVHVFRPGKSQRLSWSTSQPCPSASAQGCNATLVAIFTAQYEQQRQSALAFLSLTAVPHIYDFESPS